MSPPPDFNPVNTSNAQVAVLAGGCFWGMQGVFQHVCGILRAVVGYAGGAAMDVRYDAVATGRTGHAEVAEITFDPGETSYGELLQIYFPVVHDPTQHDRQGPNCGPQYRSAIFPHTENQTRIANAYIDQINAAKIYSSPIVTTIGPDAAFYSAEQSHQDYMVRHPCQPYIAIHDLPKVELLKRLFPKRYRASSQRVAQTQDMRKYATQGQANLR